MSFVKYHHVEKLGHQEVADILEGTVTVYPKLDGTNASVWLENNEVRAASRNRQLTLENDNAGFLAWAMEQGKLAEFLQSYERHWSKQIKLYGEWLVPHSLKTYREDAWRRFWVFDVWVDGALIPAENFDFGRYGIDYIAPLAIIENPSDTQLIRIMNETNTFMIEDGAGPGEGIVIKRYGAWRARFGGQVWAKMVRNEFKDLNRNEFGLRVTQGERQVEVEIIEEFVTSALVKKELAKIVHGYAVVNERWKYMKGSDELIAHYNEVMVTNRAKVIPRLLQTVYHCLIKEELWSALKKHKRATIDFAKLNRLCIVRTKELAPELF